jgi:threonyl-tRNA synthetase
MLIVGEKEQDSKTVSLRQHQLGDIGSLDLNDFIYNIVDEINSKANNNEERFSSLKKNTA